MSNLQAMNGGYRDHIDYYLGTITLSFDNAYQNTFDVKAVLPNEYSKMTLSNFVGLPSVSHIGYNADSPRDVNHSWVYNSTSGILTVTTASGFGSRGAAYIPVVARLNR